MTDAAENRRPSKILVVDDNVQNLELLVENTSELSTTFRPPPPSTASRPSKWSGMSGLTLSCLIS